MARPLLAVVQTRLRNCSIVFRSYSSRNVVKTLASRNMVEDLFPRESVDSLARLLEAPKPTTVYAGFDPTAPSLHVGNLLVLTSLLHFQRAGHRVVVLVGGATARIGDPSGKNSEREELDENVIVKNIDGIQNDIERIVTNHEANFWSEEQGELQRVEIVDNESWYRKMNIIDFLSSVGRNLRLGKMLSRSSVKGRLESDAGLSLTEFSYQAFQGFDWLHLLQSRGCRIQVGGKDQMGNIMAGQEIISRKCEEDVWGVTLPLIVNEEGNKFGKSAGAPVWLSESLTSAFNLYQFFMRIPDDQLPSMLRYFTFLPVGEVDMVMAKHTLAPEKRVGQTCLAKNVTLLVHGKAGLEMAQTTTNILYKQDINTLSTIDLEQARNVFTGAPFLQLLFSPGLTVLDLALKVGCFRTEKDAVRIIGAGGFSINMVRVSNTEEVLTHGKHIMENGLTLIRVGKKNFYIVEWT